MNTFKQFEICCKNIEEVNYSALHMQYLYM